MATGRDLSLLENIDEKLLECSICSETLHNPRSLACLHSFCLACLENWLKSNHGKLSCPICRKLHHIPDGGLEKLPPNTFVNNLLEITEQFKNKQQVKCVCGATEQVSYYCKECRHYLCSTCSKHHKIMPISESHKLLAAKEVQSMTPEQFGNLHPPSCCGHKPLELYLTLTINGFVEEDKNDYVIRGVCKNPGIGTLNVYLNGKPIKQSPFTIKIKKKSVFKVDKKPTGVVKCDDDYLLVSFCTNKIHKYKQSGEYISKITLPEGVKVYRMYKMKNNNIAFSDWGNISIQVCDMIGHVIKSIGKGVLKCPQGIHIDESTNVIYVAEWNTECVFMFDINSGKELMKIGSQEKVELGYSDVTLTQTGKVVVADWGNNQIVLFNNEEDKLFKVLINKGDEDGKVMWPRGVVVDEDDNIIVSSRHKLQLFSSDGHFIERIDQEKDGINNPEQLCIISYHPRRIAVANWGDSNIEIFNY